MLYNKKCTRSVHAKTKNRKYRFENKKYKKGGKWFKIEPFGTFSNKEETF